MENKVKNVLSGIGFYGTLAVCLLVCGMSHMLVRNHGAVSGGLPGGSMSGIPESGDCRETS